MGETLNATQIAAYLQAGDSRSYHESGSTAEQLTSEYKTRTDSFNKLLARMESAWTGESSDSAAKSLSALQEATTVSSENLHNVSMQMNTQGESFSKVKNEVGPGPGPQPETTFASDYFPMFTDQDEKLERWNEEAQRVVDAYNTYSNGTNENANVFPSTYGELTGSPEGLKFSVEDSGSDPGKRISNPNVGTGGVNTSSSSSSSGSGGSGSSVPSFGGGGVGSGGGGVGSGTSPSGGALTPGSSSGVGSGLPPGAIRLPDGSIQYPDGTIRTPDGRIIPPGGTRASSRGFGPGSGSGSSSGAGAAAAAGMMGGGMMGGVAAGGGDTAAPRSGFGPGGGSGAGAGSGMGGAKAMPGGMGGGMGRGGGMGMGGMMGGGAGGRGGKGEDDAEHKDEYYIRQEMDPGLKTEIDEYGEKLVDESTGMTVVPPVIGE